MEFPCYASQRRASLQTDRSEIGPAATSLARRNTLRLPIIDRHSSTSLRSFRYPDLLNHLSDPKRINPSFPPPNSCTMISDDTLTNLSNGLGVAAMAFIVLYHFVAVNGKRMEG